MNSNLLLIFYAFTWVYFVSNTSAKTEICHNTANTVSMTHIHAFLSPNFIGLTTFTISQQGAPSSWWILPVIMNRMLTWLSLVPGCRIKWILIYSSWVSHYNNIEREKRGEGETRRTRETGVRAERDICLLTSKGRTHKNIYIYQCLSYLSLNLYFDIIDRVD